MAQGKGKSKVAPLVSKAVVKVVEELRELAGKRSSSESAQAALEYLYSRNLARPHEEPGIFILTEYGAAAVELQRNEPEVHRALNDLAVAVHACDAFDEQTRAELRGNIEALHCQLRNPEPDKELLQRVWESIERLAGPATDEIEAALRAIQTYGWFLR